MKWCLLFLIICSPLQAADDPVGKDIVLEVARTTKKKIESIKSYQFLLVKRELVDGKDTGYQYLNVKVRTEPLGIYVNFPDIKNQPRSIRGREALYFQRSATDYTFVVRRGGTRMASMVMHLKPDSPFAMMDNRYTITHINPKVVAKELMEKIEAELQFPETELTVYRQAKVFDQPGTHYRLRHTEQKKGMECYVAEVMICKKLGVPIYFRVIDFNKHLVEEYAFKDMVLDAEFAPDTFDEDNPAYGFKRDEQED